LKSKNIFPDGLAGREEFTRQFIKLCPTATNAEKFVSFFFRACDQDGDGRIGYSEFVKALGFRSSGGGHYQDLDVREAFFDNFFDVFDQDGDRKISHQELEKFFDAIFEVLFECQKSSDFVKELMVKYDSDQSGYLDKKEFINFFIQEDVLTMFEF
jgi:Ca2+-binding EF-hand superfamily protein